MNRIERLVQNYRRFLAITAWDQQLAPAQRIWFAVYDKTDERRLRVRLEEFEIATKQENHDWRLIDVTNDFANWMASLDYRDSYFESPDDLNACLDEFGAYVAARIKDRMEGSSEKTVVAIHGISSLYGFIKVSKLIKDIQSNVKGRLLVFFPGEYDNNVYRLLDARDGWNYLAVPITAQEGAFNV